MTDVNSKFRATYHDHIRHDVLSHIPKTGGQLLDLGGGIGATAAAVKQNGLVERVGVADQIDNSENPAGLDFQYKGNLEDLAFIDHIVAEQGKFNMILALDILEHLVDPWKVVAKLHESLATDGVLVASIPNVRNYQALLPLLLKNKWEYEDAGILDRTHLRFFVKSSAVELVTSSGLKVEHIAGSASGGGKIRLIRKLSLGLLNSFTDRQYVIVARNEG